MKRLELSPQELFIVHEVLIAIGDQEPVERPSPPLCPTISSIRRRIREYLLSIVDDGEESRKVRAWFDREQRRIDALKSPTNQPDPGSSQQERTEDIDELMLASSTPWNPRIGTHR